MYSLRWLDPARRELQSLDAKLRTRVREAMDEVAESPYSGPNIARLTGNLRGYFRRRVGDVRIIYSVVEAEKVVWVAVIGWRGSVYEK